MHIVELRSEYLLVFLAFFILMYHCVRKVCATDSQSHLSNIWFISFCRGRIFINIEQFSFDRLFSFIRKTKHIYSYLSSSLNIDYPSGHQVFHLERPEIRKELDSAMFRPTTLSPSGFLNLNTHNMPSRFTSNRPSIHHYH